MTLFARVRRALPLALALSLFACADAGSDCTGFSCGDTYFYPQSQLPNGVAAVDDAATFRLTQAGLDFLLERLPALLEGLSVGVKKLSSLAFFLALTALSLFFLLMDGPQIRNWMEGHMRVPRPVAHQIGTRVLESLRGYFLGVTLVALFNAAVVGLLIAALYDPVWKVAIDTHVDFAIALAAFLALTQ